MIYYGDYGPCEKKYILLVEDEPIIAMAETARLEREGYAVIRAEDGEGAVRLIREGTEQVDLILMAKQLDGTLRLGGRPGLSYEPRFPALPT